MAPERTETRVTRALDMLMFVEGVVRVIAKEFCRSISISALFLKRRQREMTAVRVHHADLHHPTVTAGTLKVYCFRLGEP